MAHFHKLCRNFGSIARIYGSYIMYDRSISIALALEMANFIPTSEGHADTSVRNVRAKAEKSNLYKHNNNKYEQSRNC
jgi:hypothetical protein